MSGRRKLDLIRHLDKEWVEDMLVYSLRYTLGRSTYAPVICQDFLSPLVKYFSQKALGVMIRDMEEALTDRTSGPIPYADKWARLMTEMKVEVKIRKEEKK